MSLTRDRYTASTVVFASCLRCRQVVTIWRGRWYSPTIFERVELFTIYYELGLEPPDFRRQRPGYVHIHAT